MIILAESTKLPVNEHTSKTIEPFQKGLRAGIRTVANRQKLIKTTDRSEFGWVVVEACKSDNLASDNEDEKRLIKAERPFQKELRTGIRTVANRRKLIKITDHSEFGWVVVEAYKSDNLASDSKDEKRLIKAERDD